MRLSGAQQSPSGTAPLFCVCLGTQLAKKSHGQMHQSECSTLAF